MQQELSAQASAADDLALARAVLRKDRKATAELVSRHTGAIYSYVRNRVFPRADFVEDLVQEAFLSALQSLGSYHGAASLRAWLLGIARHKVEDFYRAQLRGAAESIEESHEDLEGAGPEIGEVIDQERLQRRVQEILGLLPDTYRWLLLWRYWEQRSAREIAAELSKSEKAVERMLARAKDQFRRRWTDEG